MSGRWIRKKNAQVGSNNFWGIKSFLFGTQWPSCALNVWCVLLVDGEHCCLLFLSIALSIQCCVQCTNCDSRRNACGHAKSRHVAYFVYYYCYFKNIYIIWSRIKCISNGLYTFNICYIRYTNNCQQHIRVPNARIYCRWEL